MKKYVKIGRSLYEVIDIAGAVFVAALAAMLASAAWLSLDWLTRNNISMWAVVVLISSTSIAGTITAIFGKTNK